MNFLIAVIVCLAAGIVCADSSAADAEPSVARREMLPSAPGGVFVADADIEFRRLSARLRGPYEVKDFFGRLSLRGDWAAGERLTFKSPGMGYWRLRVACEEGGPAEATFAVVPDPHARPRGRTSPFGVDAAFSWCASRGSFDCPWNGGDTFRTTADLLALSGVTHVRERLSWSETQPKAGAAPDFSLYLERARMLRARGLTVTDVFHDAPAFARPEKGLPRDLAALYAFCKAAGASFGDDVMCWEFWNEEDTTFSGAPVWDYMSAMKAAYLGFRAGGARLVANGAVSAVRRGVYDACLAANGLKDYCDVYNTHVYLPPSDHDAYHDDLERYLARAGMPGRARIITESGTFLEGNAKAPSVRADCAAHTPEQEAIVCEFVPKSQILHLQRGTAIDFHFVFAAYSEAGGKKDWGLLRRDGSVKPAFCAFSALCGQLGTATLLGEAEAPDGVRAFVFRQPDGTYTLACWGLSEVDEAVGSMATAALSARGTATLSLAAAGLASCSVTDIVGGKSAVTARDGVFEIPVTRFPCYVAGLKAAPRVTRPATSPGAWTPVTAAADLERRVVLQVDLNPSDFSVSRNRTLAESVADSRRLAVRVWNFSEKALAGRLETENGVLRGLPSEMSVPAQGSVAFEATYDPPEGEPGHDFDLRVGGVFGGRRISCLVLPIRLQKRFLDTCRVVELDWRTPSRWRRNTSAESCSCAWDEKEGALRFDLAWKEGVDRWFYPIYGLALPDETLVGAKKLEFAVKTAQDKVENDFFGQYVMVSEPGRPLTLIPYDAPIHVWETRLVDLGHLTFDKPPTALQLGANPKGSKMTFWLKDVRLLK